MKPKNLCPAFIRSALLFILVLSFHGLLFGQNKDGELILPDSFDHRYIFITNVEITGNEKTLDRIIIRELDFHVGDSLATFILKQQLFAGRNNKRIYLNDTTIEVTKRLKYSRENLINTDLFLSVTLILEQIHDKFYKLKIDVKERWYFWVFPVVTIDAPNINEWLDEPDKDQLNKGVFAAHTNLWGRGHSLWTVAYGGSSQRFGLGYSIPWIGKGEKVGFKTAAIYSSDAVVEYGSYDNERMMLFDKNSVNSFAFGSEFSIRPNLYNYSHVKLVMVYKSISDSLFQLNPTFLPDSAQSVINADLYIDYLYDSRNNKSYPLKGQYLKGFVNKKGLGIISYDVDYFFYGIDFHFYQTISKKFYVAEMVKAVTSSSGDVAYHYMQNLTSKEDFLRGYDHYALRGESMLYFRGNVKYELVKPTIKRPKWAKPESKFLNIQYALYLNLFSDVGYVKNSTVSDNPDDINYNPLNNKSLYSWGLGLDLVSYYNLVIRFEYAFTSEGTHGLFFGLKAPI